MKKGHVAGLVVAALVAGLALGSFGIASAAPAADAQGAGGYGLKMGSAIRDAGGRMADILADLTGLSVDDIHDRRAQGESVADIAKAEGVETTDVVDTALAARKSILDAKVADGTIDAETRDQMLANMTERINERVTSDQMGGRGNGGACGTGGGGRGAGAGGAGACGAGAGGAGACGSCTAAPVQ